MPFCSSIASSRAIWLVCETEYAPQGPNEVTNAMIQRVMGITLMLRLLFTMKYTHRPASQAPSTARM